MTTADGGAGPVALRPFRDEYAALLAIGRAIDPEDAGAAETWRADDGRWRHDRYFRERFVAEAAPGRIVGWGQVSHMLRQLHPHKYGLRLEVPPDRQGRGVGSALYERLLGTVRGRGGVAVRAATRESRRTAMDFLAHRGFREIQRYWESRLDVAGVDAARFAPAAARAAGQGVTTTTLAAELARAGEAESLLRALHELESAAFRDIPFPEPPTVAPFDEWRERTLHRPESLPDACFLAEAGGRFVGVSTLRTTPGRPGVLSQGFTGVLREYRGRGIATALKLHTVRYAREHGYREIRTGNNTRNEPMLRINEALGFQNAPAWIEYEKALPGDAAAGGGRL